MRLAIFELLFFMLVLKLPVAYAIGVVVWAIRAEAAPAGGEPVPARVTEPPPGGAPRRRPGRRPGPRGAPARVPSGRGRGRHARLGS